MSAWRLIGRGAAPFAVLVVVNAGAQALLVGLDPRQPLSVGSVLVAAASGVALLAAVAVLWLIAERSALLRRPASGLVIRTLATGVATAVAAVALPPLVPIVVVAGCALLAAGGVRAAGTMAARHPLAVTALSIVTVLTVVLAWVLDLLLGLFVTGPAAAAVSWVVAGVAAVLLACHWVALAVWPARQPRIRT